VADKNQNTIMGIKIGMTQVFDEKGQAIPVTIVQAEPNVVLQKKQIETDGYNAIQVGFMSIREKLLNKPKMGIFRKAKLKPLRHIREFSVNNVNDYEIGSQIKVDIFAPDELIDVVGTSKGKGFAGATKRHNLARGSMGHGSKYHRRPGSLGAMGPARVFPGHKMPGHMGRERVTVQCLTIVKVYPEKNLILIKGAIPGPRKGLVLIKSSIKA
jgi:large subunit ribosomal protein L3